MKSPIYAYVDLCKMDYRITQRHTLLTLKGQVNFCFNLIERTSQLFFLNLYNQPLLYFLPNTPNPTGRAPTSQYEGYGTRDPYRDARGGAERVDKAPYGSRDPYGSAPPSGAARAGGRSNVGGGGAGAGRGSYERRY